MVQQLKAIALGFVLAFVVAASIDADAREKEKGYVMSLGYDSGRLYEIETMPLVGYFNFDSYGPSANTFGPIYIMKVFSFDNNKLLMEREIQIPLYIHDIGFVNKTRINLDVPYFEQARYAAFFDGSDEVLKVDLSRFAPENVLAKYDPERLKELTASVDIEKKISKERVSIGEEIQIELAIKNDRDFEVSGKLSDSNSVLEPQEMEFPVSVKPRSTLMKSYKSKAASNKTGTFELGRAYFFLGERVFFSNAPKIEIIESGSGKKQELPTAVILIGIVAALLIAIVVIGRLVLKRREEPTPPYSSQPYETGDQQ